MIDETFETFYEAAGYSRRYGAEIDRLKRWYALHLPDPLPRITAAMRGVGLDAMGWTDRLSQRALQKWRDDYGYELSYLQSCVAFFAAYDEAFHGSVGTSEEPAEWSRGHMREDPMRT